MGFFHALSAHAFDKGGLDGPPLRFVAPYQIDPVELARQSFSLYEGLKGTSIFL